jgi:hypothetical protein
MKMTKKDENNIGYRNKKNVINGGLQQQFCQTYVDIIPLPQESLLMFVYNDQKTNYAIGVKMEWYNNLRYEKNQPLVQTFAASICIQRFE